MKIQEFRSLLKNADRDKMEKAFAECYKNFSKAQKEEIDLLVQEILSGKEIEKKKQTENFEALENEIEVFEENAYAQNYLAPNRCVPKSQRSKWRFLVMRFLKELEKIPPESEYYERSVECLWKLYRVLCEGCNVYLFSADDPFASIQREQSQLYHLLVKKTFELGYTRERMRNLILLASSGGLSRTNLYIINQMALLSELKTSDLKQLAMEETKQLIENPEPLSKKVSAYSSEAYYWKEKNNNLCELYLLISISLAEAEEGIRYFFAKVQEREAEIVLYRALACAEWMDEDQIWIDFYRYGLTRKIVPRNSLQEKYKERTNVQNNS